MTTQSFSLYTKNGYAGDLVDSAPAVKQTGILTSASVGFGKAVKRDTSVERGVAVGGAAKVFAITAREYNHEAGTRPSTGNDTFYLVTESVSLVREGYLYVLLGGAVAVSAGQVLHVDTVTGVFSKTSVAGNVVATTNVVAEEAGIAGDVIKVRIDI
tara:strand:+ start:876 stop:1346 length:471 start_codon:yes stop_codon:yes gene_type:complete